MKGDISVRTKQPRDVKLDKIAQRQGVTLNVFYGMLGELFCDIPANDFYHCAAAVKQRAEELRKLRGKKTVE